MEDYCKHYSPFQIEKALVETARSLGRSKLEIIEDIALDYQKCSFCVTFQDTKQGLTLENLRDIRTKVDPSRTQSTLYKLSTLLPTGVPSEKAFVLILKSFLSPEEKIDVYDELVGYEWPKEEVIFPSPSQVLFTKGVLEDLGGLLGKELPIIRVIVSSPPKLTGDTKLSIHVVVGNNREMEIQWFHKKKAVGRNVTIALGDGDVVIMSKKATGWDHENQHTYTLRHKI